MEICNLHKYLDPLLSTLLKHLWQRLKHWVFLGMTLEAWYNCIWRVSPILLCRSSQALSGWDGEHCCTASPLGAFWQTPSGLSCAFYWEVASVWPLNHKGLIGGVLQRWLSFWKVLPSPQRNSGAMSVWPSGSWSPPWLRPFSPNCSIWPGSSRKSLGGSNILPFKNDGGHFVLGDLQWCRNVMVSFPRSVPRHNPVSELYGQFFRSHGMVFALTCTVNCGTLYRQVFPIPNHVQSIYYRWTPIKL
jgi:hypothetical protein